MLPVVHIYTDGSCLSDGSGAWACSVYYGSEAIHLVGREEHTTNSRMELMALYQALYVLKRPCEIHLFSDSAYVIDGLSRLPQWEARDWKNARNKDVAHSDLWREIFVLSARHQIHAKHVPGHSGIVGNEIVDRLAAAAYRVLPVKDH